MKTPGSRPLRTAALTLLAAMATSSFALAQTTKKPKKKPKATTTAPAETPPLEPAPTPPPEPTPPPAPTPPPEPTPEAAPAAATTEAPKEDAAATTDDLVESPTTTYHYVGLRYRGTIVPKFMLNLFVDEGKTIYSNQIGLEYEIRRDGFSMIPWLTYAEYGTGDMLFHEKGQPVLPQWYSDVNSSLKAMYVGIDLLWSTKVSKNVEIEYGAGAGLGFVFGSLTNNWVYQDPNGILTASDGSRYSPCPNTTAGPSCDPRLHQNSDVTKVGGYQEKNWFGGGSIPALMPHLAIPEIGVRFKPTKEIAARASLGFSLTGFWFGLSGSYQIGPK